MSKPTHTDTQDCTQSGTISGILQLINQLSLSHIEDRQERRESENRIVGALEKMADQGARIIHLEAADVDFKRELNLLYSIQRELDAVIKTEDSRLTLLHTFYKLTTNKYTIAVGAILLSLLLIGSLNDLVYHSTLFTILTNKLLSIIM